MRPLTKVSPSSPESLFLLSVACALKPGSAAPTPAARPALKKSRRDWRLSSFIRSSFVNNTRRSRVRGNVRRKVRPLLRSEGDGGDGDEMKEKSTHCNP